MREYNIKGLPEIIFFNQKDQTINFNIKDIENDNFENRFLTVGFSSSELIETLYNQKDLFLHKNIDYNNFGELLPESINNLFEIAGKSIKNANRYFIYILIGTYIEQSIYDTFNKIIFGNVSAYNEYNSDLELLFTEDNLFLLYLYDDPDFVKKTNNFILNDNYKINNYSNLENIVSILEFYTISTLVGSSTPKMKFILMNIDVFNSIIGKPIYNSNPSELTLYYGNRTLIDYK